MTSSISSTSDDLVQLMMQQMMQKMSNADTDGVKGLSQEELASIDSFDDVGGSAFLKTLTEQFDTLDSDGDGQLTTEEISSVKPPSEPMGPPPGMSFDSTSTEDDEAVDFYGSVDETDKSAETAATQSTDKLLEKLLKSFKDSFVDTFDSSSDETSKDVKSLIAEADVDKNGSLSLDELSAYNKANPSDISKSLVSNFAKYDSSGDNELSEDELLVAMKPTDKEFTVRELSEMAKEMSKEGGNELGSALGNLAGSFVQKLLSSYQSGNLSDFASTLNIAV